jgi:hypothetical protein
MQSTSLLWRVDAQSRADVLHSGKVDVIYISFSRVDDQSRGDNLHSGKVDGSTSLLWRVDAQSREDVSTVAK